MGRKGNADLPEGLLLAVAWRDSGYHRLLTSGGDLAVLANSAACGWAIQFERTYVILYARQKPRGHRLAFEVQPFGRGGGFVNRELLSTTLLARRLAVTTPDDPSAVDLLSWTSYPEGERRPQPIHGSDIGANFMVDEGGRTWRYRRHDATSNELHLVGMDTSVIRSVKWAGEPAAVADRGIER